MKIHIETYTDAQGKNYGTNTLVVTLGRLTLWFSYQMVVAFQADKYSSIVGYGSPVTKMAKKHIGLIHPDEFLSGKAFRKALNEAQDQLGVFVDVAL